MRQNNITHLNQCLILDIKTTLDYRNQELNPSFLCDLHQGLVTNEYQYLTKMTLSASMGGLRGDFIAMVWRVEYLQKTIYIWNKVSKHVMFQCRMDFQSIPLHLYI